LRFAGLVTAVRAFAGVVVAARRDCPVTLPQTGFTKRVEKAGSITPTVRPRTARFGLKTVQCK
jgi:hypothetical protein